MKENTDLRVRNLIVLGQLAATKILLRYLVMPVVLHQGHILKRLVLVHHIWRGGCKVKDVSLYLKIFSCV